MKDSSAFVASRTLLLLINSILPAHFSHIHGVDFEHRPSQFTQNRGLGTSHRDRPGVPQQGVSVDYMHSYKKHHTRYVNVPFGRWSEACTADCSVAVTLPLAFCRAQ